MGLRQPNSILVLGGCDPAGNLVDAILESEIDASCVGGWVVLPIPLVHANAFGVGVVL